MKKSPFTLCVYLTIIFILFVFQLILTISLMVERDEVVDWALRHVDADEQDSIEEIRELMDN